MCDICCCCCCCCCCHRGRTFLGVLMTKPPTGPSSSWSGHHTRLPGSFFFFRAGPPAPAPAPAPELLGASPAAPSSVSRSRRISESERPRQRFDPEPRAASFADAAVPDAPALVSSSSSAHHTQGQARGQSLATGLSSLHMQMRRCRLKTAKPVSATERGEHARRARSYTPNPKAKSYTRSDKADRQRMHPNDRPNSSPGSHPIRSH